MDVPSACLRRKQRPIEKKLQAESPLESPDNFIKYTLPFEDRDLVFYKSQFTQRWWVGVSFLETEDNKAAATALLPCTEQDYLAACNHNIPERWFKAQKKGFI